MPKVLPSGHVTFAFTDVVGSTRAFTEHGQLYADALPHLHNQIAEVTAAHGGVVVKTEGDGAFLAFPRADGAVRALCDIQDRLEREPSDGIHLRIRAGAHAGEAVPIDGDYLALAVHIAARVSSAAGAGQVLVSSSVVEELGTSGPEPDRLVDVGVFELKDVREPMQLWRVAGDDTPPRATPARRTNVAAPHTSFVARDLELDELGRLLGSAGLVTVVGPGGVGKTRLVSEYALRNAPDRADGIWLVELAHLSNADQLPGAVGLTLGLSGSPTPDLLAAELAGRGAPLLILDNCEHLADAAAELLADLLRLHPSLSVVATSREPLEVMGERVQRLAPLSASESAPGAAPTAAEVLFLSRAQTAGGEMAAEDLPAITEICQLLDGLPLAVELAAARAAYMSPRDLLDELQQGNLELRRRGGAQRQRSLEALVGWSLDLLDQRHRDAVLVLSVFPGRFSNTMARHVLNSVEGLPPAALPELVRRSLIDLDGADYRMLSIIRDVMKAELSKRPELARRAMAGLFAWAVDVSSPSERRREGNERLTEPQARSLEAALAWALPERREGCGDVMRMLVWWIFAHVSSRTANRLAHTVLLGPAPRTCTEVQLHAACTRLLSGVGFGRPVSAEQARALLAAAYQFCPEDSDEYEYAVDEAATGLAAHGYLEEALSLQRRLLDLATYDAARAGALTSIGTSHHLLGDLAEAERCYREALEITAYGSSNYLVLMGNLGEVLLDLGRLDEAVTQLRATVRITHGRAINAWAAGLLVVAEAERGEVEVARALAGEAEAALEQVVRADDSVSYVLDRLRQALARLPA